ncbi:hypothetical protein Tco_0126992 [Tanacetum coccineum]
MASIKLVVELPFNVVMLYSTRYSPLRKDVEVQTALDSDPSNISIREKEAAVVVAFNDALLMEEKFLKQKAKITWLKEGDSNIAYFHKMVKSRLVVLNNCVTDANGVVFQNEDVAKAFINHYEVFLGQPGITSAFNTNNLFPTRLNDIEALNMAAFFKHLEIIGSDVTKAICEFFTNGRFLKELNHTIIALIPKVNARARLISEKRMSDESGWEFLKGALIGFGFHDRMISWIMECVTTTSFSISINGSLHGYFKGKKGSSSRLLALLYHRYCSDLELINLCFADDLFLFAYGDVHLAKVIKEALVEFKDASVVMSADSAVTYTSVHSEARSWSIPSEDPYEEAARQLLEQAPRSPEYVPDPMELEDHVPVYIPEPKHPEDLVPAEDEAPTPLLPPSLINLHAFVAPNSNEHSLLR